IFQKSLAGVGEGLYTIQCKEGLAVEGFNGQTVRFFSADELAVILDVSLGAGMGAARRNGERHTSEAENLKGNFRCAFDDLADRGKWQLGRQADGCRSAHGQNLGRRRIVNINERTDRMGLAG